MLVRNISKPPNSMIITKAKMKPRCWQGNLHRCNQHLKVRYNHCHN